MADERLRAMTDDELGAALRALAPAIATRDVAATADRTALDPARRVRLRLEADAARRDGRRSPTPVRRSLLLAAALFLAIAAVAGAVGLGLPGIRILPAGSGPVAPSVPGASDAPAVSPSPISPPARSGPPGAGLGLGAQVPVGTVADAVDFPVRLPTDPVAGPPDSAWLLDGRLSLVWRARAGLPALDDPRVGLVLSQFRGTLDEGYFGKILGPGTTLTPVTVAGEAGWWLSGEAHELIYIGPDGQPAFDSHRFVGDALLWTDGGLTYRLESGLEMAATIRLAESLR